MPRQRNRRKFRGGIDENAESQRNAAAQYSYLKLPQGVDIFKVTPGERVKLDFLLYEITTPKHPDRDPEGRFATEEDLWYRRPFSIHRNVGSQNEALICPASVGKKCPICLFRSQRMRTGADKEETDPMKPTHRSLYVVIPLGHNDYEEKPYVWDFSNFLFQKLLNDELKEDPNYKKFPQFDGGYTVKIRFEKTVIGNSQPFATAKRIDFEEREPYDEEALYDDIPHLDDMLTILDYKEVEEKFLDLDEEPGPEEDEGSEPPVEEEEEKPKSYRRPKDVEPDEPATDADSEADEKPKEEEEKSKPKRQAKKEEGNEGEENKCPHGHEYGVDAETKKGCDNCDVWEECLEVKTTNEKS